MFIKWIQRLGSAKQIALLAGLGGIGILTGCAFGGCEKRKKNFRFQVDPTSELYTAAVEAAANWTRATGVMCTVSADGDIPIILTPNPECPLPPEYAGTGKVVMGCTMDTDKDGARIEMNVKNLSAPPEELVVNIMHEMGHILRGDYDHLNNPEDKCCIMAPAYDTCKRAITPKDIDFICQCLECPASPNS